MIPDHTGRYSRRLVVCMVCMIHLHERCALVLHTPASCCCTLKMLLHSVFVLAICCHYSPERVWSPMQCFCCIIMQSTLHALRGSSWVLALKRNHPLALLLLLVLVHGLAGPCLAPCAPCSAWTLPCPSLPTLHCHPELLMLHPAPHPEFLMLHAAPPQSH